MHIQKAVTDDLDKIMEIYEIAQNFMIKSGNPTQWGHHYPTKELIENDIENEICYLIYENESPHGVFALFRGDEPTYRYIENGEWLNDDAYVTVHRIASDGKCRGIFDCAIKYCKSISKNIRIDTHKNNLVMQKLIERNDFKKCGTVYVNDKSARIAYQWTESLPE
ncbi:hypothetical protein [uncultured Methanobrevibacter sp.]|uniref:hypothetical protein n=1 Tax=uncultured Methanobrevibacter sp. TaxID=253161 RepID=UPI00260080BC|nr:hypothetical protein [uncultured Methanobrevibacter sp.]